MNNLDKIKQIEAFLAKKTPEEREVLLAMSGWDEVLRNAELRAQLDIIIKEIGLMESTIDNT